MHFLTIIKYSVHTTEWVRPSEGRRGMQSASSLSLSNGLLVGNASQIWAIRERERERGTDSIARYP